MNGTWRHLTRRDGSGDQLEGTRWLGLHKTVNYWMMDSCSRLLAAVGANSSRVDRCAEEVTQ